MEKYNDKKYRFGRNISSFVVNKTLHPTIIGSDNIPKKGPLIFCGNHLHVWDQFPVMCGTKHVIHWMAKKEYFDGKLGNIFKFMGCIPVDRQGNPHESKKIALEYLQSGSNIGLFPEGTRNGLKEDKIVDIYNYLCETVSNNVSSYEEFKCAISEQNPRTSQIDYIISLSQSGVIAPQLLYFALINSDQFLRQCLKLGWIPEEEYYDSLLLPFKYGAVSMAKETNSLIVPFGVTGQYKMGNDDLTITFGFPMDVVSDELPEANKKLRKEVLTLVRKNYKR